jgi:NADPH:quinone reductase-like Zn-dependent oxidoreductase
VLVTGAAGGVGRFATQLAHAGGATVTAVVGDASRGEGLDRLGASEIVLEDHEHAEPFDLVLDMVGGPVLERAIAALGPGATAVLIGMASGERARIGLFDFQHGPGARLQPFRLYLTDVNTFGEDLGFLARSIDEGRIEAPIGLQVSWSELPRAMDALRDRQVRGKVVFTIDPA